MRFLLSALSVVALVATIDAKMMTASVGPITENPIPVWGLPASDACSAIGSCDACQASGNQYCYYKESGDATCCQGNKPAAAAGTDDSEANSNSNSNSNDEPATLVASVGPITENPVPSWSNPETDSCSTVGSCDACQPGDSQYCYYKESGDATCCHGNNSNNSDKPLSGSDDGDSTRTDNDNKNDADMPLVASVGPITENPVPRWGKPDIDSCSTVGSCDACQPGGAQYCYYKDSGDATCCQGTPDGDSDNKGNDDAIAQTSSSSSSSSPAAASAGPSEEDPIPSWARPDDTCSRKRSCDACRLSQVASTYCKYTESGIPQCCMGKRAAEEAGNENNANMNDANAPVDSEAQQMEP